MRIYDEHIKAIIWGVAVGDALGVPVEFLSRKTMEANPLADMIGYGTHHQPPGTWSDDSSLTFCLAETLLDDKFEIRKLANRFINWVDFAYWTAHDEVFDIGNTTSLSIERLRSSNDPVLAGGSTVHSNGNGSLMRILPLVFKTIKLSFGMTFDMVKSVSSLTHRHDRSIIACYYYIILAEQLIRGNNIQQAYQQTNRFVQEELLNRGISQEEKEHFTRIFDGSLPSLDYRDLRGSGYVIHSLEAAIWCSINSSNYTDAVLQAVNLGEDTDTTAAITGGLAALVHGYESIPGHWLRQLAKKEEIDDLIERLIEKYTRKIKLDVIPKSGDMKGANAFAHKYSGYKNSSKRTFEEVKLTRAKIEANETEDLGVEEIARSLFVHFRAVRHGGGHPDEYLVNQHLDLLRLKVT